MSKRNSKNFEQSLMRLEEIADKLESDEIGLEDALLLYEEGINLSRECLNSLKNAEIKITELKKKVEDISIGEKDLFDE
ncbi:MAG: exodeoxyribonuclease VII small subunit [Ignavibacteriales bacterium]|nr:MAG: exodeoxyribonuclease VII small subunit [Ignavibacteriales bacterium]